MQRLQSAPPTSFEEPAAPSLRLPGLEALSLEGRLEALRGPWATREEVDALLATLAVPLAADESPRARADLLLTLLEDERMGGFTGTDGRPVREVALEALLALGYPYALEVPPEALERVRGWRFQPVPRALWVGVGLSLSTVLAQAVTRWMLFDTPTEAHSPALFEEARSAHMVEHLSLTAPFLAVPAMLSVLTAWLGLRKVRELLMTLMLLVGALCLFLAWILLKADATGAWGLVLLYSALAQGAAAFCQREKP